MRITLQPENNRDISVDELQELAREVKEAITDRGYTADVHVTSVDEFGSGLSWDEVLNFIIEAMPSVEVYRDVLVGVAIEKVLEWMRRRFAKSLSEAERTRVVKIFGPDGELIAVYRIEGPDADPERIQIDDN